MTNNPTSTDPIKTQAQGCGMGVRAGYENGSGDNYITRDNKPIASVSWGCGCCQCDPTPDEIKIRDEIVRAVNQSALFERAMACLNKLVTQGCWLEPDYDEAKAILREKERI